MNKTAKIAIICGAFLGAMLLVLGVCLLVLPSSKNDEVMEESELVAEKGPEPIVNPKPTKAGLKVLFAGTTFWGRRTNTKVRASDMGVKYPFSQLDTLKREDYDAWIAGLECPLTDNGHNMAEEENIFKFNCDPDYLPEAQKYFTAFLLGNNHTDNQGPEGFEKTKEYLKQYNIQYFGSYDYADGENNCGVVVLPVNLTLDNGEVEKHKMPFGFCSAHGVFGIPVEAARANMAKYAEVVPTVAMPHMGAEYETSNDVLRTNLYHDMIDRGVEAVIADHPHTIQNTEAYNGKLIAYAMGNFMFDQATLETARSATFEADISIDIEGVDFEKWDEVSKKCKELNGDCYDEIAASGLPKLKTDWKYDYHGTTTDFNTLIPRAATKAENLAIGQRLNWSAIPAELKINR